MIENDPRDARSFFGVGADFSKDAAKTLSALKTSGAGWVRLAFPKQETDDLSRWVDGVRSQGIAILAVLPSEFSRELIARYRDRVRRWQIGDQPDDDLRTPQDDLRTYTADLIGGAKDIRALDPSARIHLGGLGRGLPRSLKSIYTHGGRDAFDVVQIQPFINPMMPDALGGLDYFYGRVRKIIEEAGDTKPVWFSSIGCPGVSPTEHISDWWLGKNPTETIQAEWVRSLYARVRSWPGLERVIWSDLCDAAAELENGAQRMGLLRPDFSPKPAFAAYRQAAAESQPVAKR